MARTLNDIINSGHSVRVSAIACVLAKWLGQTEAQLEETRISALYHDAGKLYVPVEILDKDGPLTTEEFAVVKTHTTKGYEHLKTLGAKFERAAEVAYLHHERIDGSGYPHGLMEDDIPKNVLIISLADVYDALRTERSYKKALPVDQTIRLIKDGACGAFPAHLLVLLDNQDLIDEIEQELGRLS